MTVWQRLRCVLGAHEKVQDWLPTPESVLLFPIWRCRHCWRTWSRTGLLKRGTDGG